MVSTTIPIPLDVMRARQLPTKTARPTPGPGWKPPASGPRELRLCRHRLDAAGIVAAAGRLLGGQ